MSAVTTGSSVQRADQLKQQLAAAQRLLKAREAKDSLIAFTEFTMPDPNDPDDPGKSRYDAQYFHKALAAALEEVEAGRLNKLIITFPPQHGKTTLACLQFIPWLLGRDPYRNVIFGTYNQPRASKWGKKVRDIMNSPQYRTVFPGCVLATGHASGEHLGTTEGGEANFVGREGSATGEGAHVFLVDDPVKDQKEANSPVVRNDTWDWFTTVVSTRLRSDLCAMIIILTRWSDDDIVGRLTDPLNPLFNAEEAAEWKIINFKALAEEDDVLGRKPGEALWPERYGAKWLLGKKQLSPTTFSALYQQSPTPADGSFFLREHCLKYNLDDQPRALRIYAASDHAVATKQQNDRTCLLVAGVDSENVIWLLDAYWKRAKTDVVAEAMIEMQRKWKPLIWAAERGQITQSIGPFLRRRMREEEVYLNLRESPAVKDKMTRAQSIQGRCAQGMVRFPAHRPWCNDAIEELLKFPQGRFDDFVDAFAHLGMLLSILVRAANDDADAGRPKEPKVGTLGWIKKAGDAERREQARVISMRGM